MSYSDAARRARNESETGRWRRDQQALAAAQASSLANADHFLAILHQYKVRPYAVYFRPGAAPDSKYGLLAERGWMIDPPRLPHQPGIVLTESGRFYWYFHLREATRPDKGVEHERFYEVAYHPDRPGIEVPPFLFSDFSALGKASGLAAVYLENLIALLENPGNRSTSEHGSELPLGAIFP
jgi:hypothetical protein